MSKRLHPRWLVSDRPEAAQPPIREDVELEVAAHLDLTVEELIAEGWAPADAREEALRRFGDPTDVSRECQEIVRSRDRKLRLKYFLNGLGGDARIAFRGLSKQPSFAIVSIATLALGIGATTSMFSVINAVLLSPLPYREPGELVLVSETDPQLTTDRLDVSPANFVDWRDQNRVFESVVAFRPWGYVITGGGEAERLPGMRVSADFFRALEINPSLGRLFLADEDQPGAQSVALVSHGLWQRRFGADTTMVGQLIPLDGQSVTLIGVLPPDFRFLDDRVDVWVPYVFRPYELENRDRQSVQVLARLAPGVEITEAQTEMDIISDRLAAEYSDTNAVRGAVVVPLHAALVAETRSTLLLLFGAVGLVLLIACVNVASLLLARATVRSQEFAIRQSLGAGTRRLVRLCLIESTILTLLGAALSLPVTAWAVGLLRTVSSVPRISEAGVELPVLTFAFGTALLTGAVFAVIPVLKFLPRSITSALIEGGNRASEGLKARRARRVLVSAEVAMAVVLLLGTGLMIKSLARLARVDPGFNPYNLIALSVSLPAEGYPGPNEKALYFVDALGRIETLPGVESAAMVSHLPLSGADFRTDFAIRGQASLASSETPTASVRQVDPSYFRTMEIPVRSGRSFTTHDVPGSPPVALINEAAVRRYWPGQSPIGVQVIVGMDGVTREIIGVVGDVKYDRLDTDAGPQLFTPYYQSPWPSMSLLVRTETKPDALVPTLRAELHAIDADQPIDRVATMETILKASFATERFLFTLFGILASISLLLAALGIFGVVAYAVSQQTREIGIRMALGADAGRIKAQVVRHGLVPVLIGIVLGAGVALSLTHVLTAVLFGVRPTDPGVFAGVAGTLIVTALVAAYIPARHASRVDPTVALRQG